MRARAGDRADLIAITTPALLAVLVCAIGLSSRSLWLDEGASISIASRHGQELWRGIEHDGGNMAAYYLLLHVIIVLFGDGLAVMRLPSMLGDGITAGLVSALALRLLGGPRRRWIALCAGSMSAISLPLVYWGQNARGYALMVTFATASWYAFTVILQTPDDKPVPRAAVWGYGLSTLIALYIGFDIALLLPAQLLLLLVFPGRARAVLGTLVSVAVFCVPLLILATTRGSGQLFWVPPLSVHTLGQSAVTLASGGLPPNFRETLTTAPLAVLTLGLALAALVLIVRAQRREGVRGLALRGPGAALTTPGRWPVVLLASWLFVPSFIGVVGNLVGVPVELARTTILVMPALVLLVCWVLAQPGLPARTLPIGVGVLLALRLFQLVPSYGTSPEDWQAAATTVLSKAAAQPACVLFYPQDGRMPFDYYMRQDLQTQAFAVGNLTPVIPDTPWSIVQPFVEKYRAPSVGQITQIIQQCPRLWLIASHQGQHEPAASLIDLNRYNRLVTSLTGAYPYSHFQDFGYAAVIHTALFSFRRLPNPLEETNVATPRKPMPLAQQDLAWNGAGGALMGTDKSPSTRGEMSGTA